MCPPKAVWLITIYYQLHEKDSLPKTFCHLKVWGMPVRKVAEGGERSNYSQVWIKLSTVFALGFNCKVPTKSNVSCGDSTSQWKFICHCISRDAAKNRCAWHLRLSQNHKCANCKVIPCVTEQIAAANGLAFPGTESGSCPMVQSLGHTVSLHCSPFACLDLLHECISCH